MPKMPKNVWAKTLNEIENKEYPSNELDLSKCELTDDDIQALAAAIGTNTRIKSINLSWNKIGPAGAEFLAKSKNTSIEKINLSFNFIGKGANFLFENKNVKELDLSFNQIEASDVEFCSNNTTLSWLNLRSNRLGPLGAKFLANSNVKYLDICTNHIGDEGAKYLYQNKSITTLVVNNNEISDEGALLIAKEMNVLQHLYIGNNSAISQTTREIFAKLEPPKQKDVPSLKSLSVFAIKARYSLHRPALDVLPMELIDLIKTPEMKVNF